MERRSPSSSSSHQRKRRRKKSLSWGKLCRHKRVLLGRKNGKKTQVGKSGLAIDGEVDRYTCRTPHVHMYSHCTDHTAQITCVHGSGLSCVSKIGLSSTRHVSPCASQYTEHQHKFSLTYLSCDTVVFFSEPRPVVHASMYSL